MRAPFAHAPDQTLAREFARRVVHWAREREAPDHTLGVLEAAAQAASEATASGHVCSNLADIATKETLEESTLRARLLESRLVGTPEVPDNCPLILDADGRLYLRRYFDYECRLAKRLLEPSPSPPHLLGTAVPALLGQLFAGNAKRLGDRADWQKIATALALVGRLTIISGGPGTGKTTTVVSILACILTGNPDCRIRLAAPTGKAAARMLEAMRQAAAHWPEDLRERLPAESFTVHRLLGALPDAGEFRHHAGMPLPLDLLIVDEASMLDLALTTKLLEAVPLSARVILLGDKDQLAAVESGAVFSELSADPTLSAGCTKRLSEITGIPAARIAPLAPVHPSGLADSVVWLTENFRFAKDSGIGRLAAHVNAGDAQGAIELLRSHADPSVEWLDDTASTLSDASRERIVAGMQRYLEHARDEAGNRPALFAAFAGFRVLCAEREGARGVVEINRQVSQYLRRTLAHPLDPGSRSEWYPGRPVMVLRNDYVLKLFNGDVGIVLPDASGTLLVFFPDSDGGFRPVAPLRLPEHETAFASTVHKAQGSEFDRVLLLLPATPSRAVTRELLYTAVTRARTGVTVIGGQDVIEKALASPTRRDSGLIARLQEARGHESGVHARPDS